MDRALEGVRVIDLGHGLAAPWCAMFLGDLGAEVIKVEPPGGDEARGVGPFVGEPTENRSSYFININRNKKSMVLDLSREKGREVLRDLVKVSDVLIENFEPTTTMEEMGFGWKQLKKINPRIIYASISCCGHDSLPEFASWPARDLIVQALSGLMSITGTPDGTIARVGAPLADFYAAAQAAIGVLAALLYRSSVGRGQWHDGAEVDSLTYVLENAVIRYTNDGTIPRPLGGIHPAITPFQGYESKDGWIIVPSGNDRLWALLCSKLLGREDLIHHPKFETNALRTNNRDELNSILEPIFKEKTREISEDDNIKYRNMIVEIDQPEAGKVKIINSALCHMSETPGEVYSPAPCLGEHTEEILSQILGYSKEVINELKQTGVVK